MRWQHVFRFGLFLTLAGCAGDGSQPGPTVSLDAASTLDFHPRGVIASAQYCGFNSITYDMASIEIKEDDSATSPTLSFGYMLGLPVAGQHYVIDNPNPSPSQIGMGVSESIGAMRIYAMYTVDGTQCVGCTTTGDPNAIVHADLVFNQVGGHDGDTIGGDFDITIVSGARVKGSFSAPLSVTQVSCYTND